MTGVWILVGVGAVLLLYVAVLYAVLWVSLRPLRIPIYLSPGGMGVPHEDVVIPAAGGDVVGWWTQGEGPNVAILLHGYMMNRSELVPTGVWLAQRGFSVLTIDFAAHGHARGKKTGLGYPERTEVLAACRWVKERVPHAKIVLIGSSMGSAAAAFALADEPDAADAIVLDSAYSKLNDAVEGWWSLFGGVWLKRLASPTVYLAPPLVGFLPQKADVAKALQKSTVPVLVLHGDHDKLALPNQAERNMASLGNRGKMVWFPQCRHSEGRWMLPDLYFESLGCWLDEIGFLEQVSDATEVEAFMG